MDPSTPLPQSTTSTGSALPSSPSSTAADGFPLPSFLSNAPSTSHLAAPVPAPTLERTTSDILASQGEELVLHPETALAPAGVEPHPEPVSEVEHGAVESTRNGEGEVESFPSTPTFTLSEPTSERTEVVEREEEHLHGGRSEKRFSNETVRMAKEHDEEAAEVARVFPPLLSSPYALSDALPQQTRTDAISLLFRRMTTAIRIRTVRILSPFFPSHAD